LRQNRTTSIGKTGNIDLSISPRWVKISDRVSSVKISSPTDS